MINHCQHRQSHTMNNDQPRDEQNTLLEIDSPILVDLLRRHSSRIEERSSPRSLTMRIFWKCSKRSSSVFVRLICRHQRRTFVDVVLVFLCLVDSRWIRWWSYRPMRIATLRCALLCHCPSLEQLVVHQSVFNHFPLWQTLFILSTVVSSSIDNWSFRTSLFVADRERMFWRSSVEIVHIERSAEDGPSVRSFVAWTCHHRHRPVSLVDLLQQVFRQRRRLSLEFLEVGCCFERDELHLHGIASSILRKSLPEQIQSEPFQSTQCGTVQMHFCSSWMAPLTSFPNKQFSFINTGDDVRWQKMVLDRTPSRYSRYVYIWTK